MLNLKTSTALCLILLRLAIGWHLLVEGLAKLDSFQSGPTTRGGVWSSKPYLLESTGPFADWFRSIPGDPDAAALALLRVPTTPEPQLPAPLYQEWENYFQRWTTHYGLTAEQQPKAREIFTKHCTEAAAWFRNGVKDVVRLFPSGAVTIKRTTQERLAEYEQALQELRELNHSLTAFNRDVWRDKLKATKAQVASLRTDLLKDLDDKTAQLNRSLRELLTPEQQKKGPLMLEPAPSRMLWWADVTTAWGLTICGALLLLGLFTRLACVGSIGLLLLFYLAMPPLPWLPENPKAEGHYLLINKTLIEIIALGVLATLPTGRWAGLDALLAMVFKKKPLAATGEK